MNYKQYHNPVLISPLVEHFGVENDSIVLDGTLGFGGHASEILSRFPSVAYLGFDRDVFALKKASERCNKYINFKSIKGSFSSMIDYSHENKINITHILLDLGVSSYQIDQSERGFTFQKDEPLDMRMDLSGKVTAKDILLTYTPEQLEDLFSGGGDIRHPSKLVDRIIEKRSNQSLNTSFDLLDCVKRSFYHRSRQQYIATATRVFQAIRIEVNQEFDELNKILADILTLKGVTIAIITFQPNEDRLIKSFIKENNLKTVKKKPFMASYHECKKNPREKTAKLRIFYV